MKIAVNYENGMVYQHFGDTPMFKIYNVEDKKIISTQLIQANPQGHRTLAPQLINEGVNVVICGSLGIPMVQLLQQGNIEICANVNEKADDAVQQYLDGTLVYSLDAHQCNCGH